MLKEASTKIIISLVFIALIFIFSPTKQGEAKCPTSGVNLMDMVNWDSIYPLYIAGVELASSRDDVTTWPASSDVICTCPSFPTDRFGLNLGFWEPARLIETVKDPYCYPALNTQTNSTGGAKLGGAVGGAEENPQTFAQAHFYVFPIWEIMEIITDSSCSEGSGFDLDYMTESDALWQDDSLTAVITPEVVLFANPVAILACIADSISSAAGMSLDTLYWCMGSWGSAYPLTGHLDSKSYVQANAGIAARLLYKLAREFYVCDTNVNICSCIPTPIWIKGNYKMHISYPVKDSKAHSIGTTGLLWSMDKNPPVGGDNFVWMLYRFRDCCAF